MRCALIASAAFLALQGMHDYISPAMSFGLALGGLLTAGATLLTPASGIEARSAETRSGLAEGESPTPAGVMPDGALHARTTDGGDA